MSENLIVPRRKITRGSLKRFSSRRNVCQIVPRTRMSQEEVCKLNETTPGDCISILKNMENYMFTQKEISIITHFIQIGDFPQKLEEKKFEKAQMEKLFTQWATLISLVTFKSGEQIIRMNVTPPCLYILLEGTVKIISVKSSLKFITAYDYYKWIISCQDDYLLHKTIEKNNNIFPIKIEDVRNLKIIMVKVLYNNFLFGGKPSVFQEIKRLSSIIEKSMIDLKEHGFNQEINVFTLQKLKDFLLNLCSSVPNEAMLSYHYLTNTERNFTVCLYEYSDEVKSSTGTVLDDISCSFLAECKVYCLAIPYEVYKQNVQQETEKIAAKEINFLLQTILFSSIKYNKFKRAYYNKFTLKKYQKGTVIVKENSPLHKIYIVKTGEIQLGIKGTIAQISSVGQDLSNLISKKSQNSTNKEVSDDNKVHNCKVINLSKGEFFGCELFFFHVDNVFRVEINSEVAKILEIEVDSFKEILKENSEIEPILEEYSKKKISTFHTRIENLLNCLQRNFQTKSVINDYKAPEKRRSQIFMTHEEMLNKALLSPMRSPNASLNNNKSQNAFSGSQNPVNSKTIANMKQNGFAYHHHYTSTQYPQILSPTRMTQTRRETNILLKSDDKGNFINPKKPKLRFEDLLLKKVKEMKNMDKFLTSEISKPNYTLYKTTIPIKKKKDIYVKLKKRRFVEASTNTNLKTSYNNYHHSSVQPNVAEFTTATDPDEAYGTDPNKMISSFSSMKGKSMNTSVIFAKIRKHLMYKRYIDTKLNNIQM